MELKQKSTTGLKTHTQKIKVFIYGSAPNISSSKLSQKIMPPDFVAMAGSKGLGIGGIETRRAGNAGMCLGKRMGVNHPGQPLSALATTTRPHYQAGNFVSRAGGSRCKQAPFPSIICLHLCGLAPKSMLLARVYKGRVGSLFTAEGPGGNPRKPAFLQKAI